MGGETHARQSVGPNGAVSAWQQSYSIPCGMYGRQESNRACSLDLASLPFYWALCRPATGRSPEYQETWARARGDCSPFRRQTETLCNVIDDNFRPGGMSDAQRRSVGEALNRLVDVLGSDGAVGSRDSYLDRASCSQSLHDLWQQDPYGVRGMYGLPKIYSFHLFLSHTTLEVPIAFWFKCIVLEGRTIHVQGFGPRSIVDCEVRSLPLCPRPDPPMGPLMAPLPCAGVVRVAEHRAAGPAGQLRLRGGPAGRAQVGRWHHHQGPCSAGGARDGRTRGRQALRPRHGLLAPGGLQRALHAVPPPPKVQAQGPDHAGVPGEHRQVGPEALLVRSPALP